MTIQNVEGNDIKETTVAETQPNADEVAVPAVEGEAPAAEEAPKKLTREEKKAAFLADKKRRDKEKKAAESARKKAEFIDGLKAALSLCKQLIVSGDFIFLLLGCAFSVVMGLIPLLFYLIFGDIIEVMSVPGKTSEQIQSEINALALKLTYIAIGSGVAQGLYQLFTGITQTRLGSSLRKKYFGKLVEQDLAFFDKAKTGELMNHLSEGVTSVETAVSSAIPKFFELIATGIAGLVLAFIHSWMMSLFLLAVTPVLFIVMIIVGTVSGIFVSLLQKKSDESAAHLTEVVSSMKTVRTMGGEVKEARDFNSRLGKINLLGLFSGTSMGFAFGVIFFLIWGLCAYGFFIGGILVIDGIDGHKISLANMMKVFGFMLLAVVGIAMGAQPAQQLTEAFMHNAKLWKVINKKPSIPVSGGKTIDNVQGKIEFRNVSFAYPTHPDTLVLKNFTYTFEAGQQIALVGQSGSGKSTIVSLIARFYDPTEGDIFIDGINIKDLDPVWLHKVVGMVNQEPVLFQDTISNNIKYSVAKSMKKVDMAAISDHEVTQSAVVANAHNFIMGLVKGYDTMIGERGTSLSGGQKQRVAIARAVLQDPSILLLDEATSALDTESEVVVQEALDNIIKSRRRTSVSIAHRLSTIQDSDDILVFVRGVLMEHGTHQELLAKDGVYAVLASKQLKMGQDAESSDAVADVEKAATPLQEVVASTSDDADVNIVEVQPVSEKPATPEAVVATIATDDAASTTPVADDN